MQGMQKRMDKGQVLPAERYIAMTIHRHAAKGDANQPEIVEAIRKAGWEAHIVRRPCDLFCWHPLHDVWLPLEVKDPSKVTKSGKPVHDSRMEEQARFLERTGTPVVTTAEEALLALAAAIDRKIQPPSAAGRVG